MRNTFLARLVWLTALQKTQIQTLGWAWVGEIPWRSKWQLTPVFLPAETHRQRSLVGYSPWGHKQSDTTEQLNHHHVSLCPVLGVGQKGTDFLIQTVDGKAY